MAAKKKATARAQSKMRAEARERKRIEREALFRKRSRAAKKGWKTRRAQEEKAAKKVLKHALRNERTKLRNYEKATGQSAPEVPRAKPKKPKKANAKKANAKKKPRKGKKPKFGEGLTRAELLAALEEETRRREDAELELRAKDWPDLLDPEWLHDDGTVALYSSRLRHLPETPRIRRDLIHAELISDAELLITANLLAEEYGVTVREVYTVLRSP